MADIAIVTDAGCDLTREQARSLGIVIVPLVVRFGDDVDDDGSLGTEGFWQRVEESPPYPETSQPSPAAFEAAFAPLVEAGRQVVCPLISERLSGTSNAARLAARRFGDRVHVFDTRSLSLAQAQQVLRAAEHARDAPHHRQQARRAPAAAQEVEGLQHDHEACPVSHVSEVLEQAVERRATPRVLGCPQHLLRLRER